MSMDMVEMAMEMVNEVASVWVFLGGARGWRSGTIQIQLLSTNGQKDDLKCGLITWIFEFKIRNERAFPGRHDAIFSNRKLPISAVRMRDDVITEFLHS